MESQELFKKLENTNPVTARRLLIDYLHEASQKLTLAKGSTPEIAYGIAGMFATNFARSLDEDDPLTEIMTIAGELEVNPENSDELRKELIDKITKL